MHRCCRTSRRSVSRERGSCSANSSQLPCQVRSLVFVSLLIFEMTDSVTKVDVFRDEVAHIEDVADLNRKRGTKKATITKAQNFLEKLDTNPDSWNIADLVKKYDGLNIACNQYIIVAERIAAIEKVDFDADYDPQIADNTAVQLDFEKRQIIYTAHLRYVNPMERLESIYAQSVVTGMATIKSFDSLSDDIGNFKQETVALRSVEQVRNWRNEIEDIVAHIRLRMDNQPKSRPTSPVSSTPTSTNVKYRSTLKVDLPKFDGNPVNWKNFWALFEPRIEREKYLANSEKISALQAAMITDKSKQEVARAAVGGSYKEVVQELQLLYDRPRLVYEHHIQRFDELEDIPDTFEGLKHFQDEFKTSIQGLKANGGWTAGQLATGVKIRGLKGMTRERWNDKISTMTTPPTNEEFIEFLEARIASKESESLTKYNPYNDSSSVKGQLQPKKAKDKKMLRVSQSHSNSSNLSCNLCHRSHYTYKCPTLLSQTVDQRSETVKQNRLCFNCLGTDHSAYNCPSKKNCRECNRRHNSLLHRTSTSYTAPLRP